MTLTSDFMGPLYRFSVRVKQVINQHYILFTLLHVPRVDDTTYQTTISVRVKVRVLSLTRNALLQMYNSSYKKSLPLGQAKLISSFA